ncbi:hypothetical protein BJ165DRAFT_1522108 [Panaeolus papilionaceus]|nr:hypothetical protein BJ165DRAFT_1522108 [Panaeolus papilionaceus]
MSENNPPGPSKPTLSKWLPTISDQPNHPSQIALRTYALALSLSLGPSLIPFVASLAVPKFRGPKTSFTALKQVLRRELGHDSFAFAITFSVAGGAMIKQLLKTVTQQKQEGSSGDDWHNKNPSSNGLLSTLNTTLPRHVRILLTRFKKLLLESSTENITFLSNMISASVGIVLLQAGRNRAARLRRPRGKDTPFLADLTSPTLDLTLLLFVRAVDSAIQSLILHQTNPPPSETKKRGEADPVSVSRMVHEKLERERLKRVNAMRQKLTSQVDAFVFWACSARIMWCFFYEPHRLPRSYVKWINTLANLDGRIIDILQAIRAGNWSYITGSTARGHLLQDSAQSLGYPRSWGDPSVLPAYGGKVADEVWKKIGVSSRPGLGGIPCEVLHAEVGSSLGLQTSCTANAGLRALKGFTDALTIYLPVHFLPVLLTRPQIILRPHRVLETVFGAVRSATFLSSFIGLYWYSVCLTRTLVLARLFPFISHDFWDGPFGCIMAGCLACGGSIWIENGRRRGEMALYVLPRAVRACLPDAWVKSGRPGVKLVERLAFVLSISTLLTAAAHRPDSLRGLSRWTLAFVTNGPSAGFWKRKRRDPSIPPTPSVPLTPAIQSSNSNTIPEPVHQRNSA